MTEELLNKIKEDSKKERENIISNNADKLRLKELMKKRDVEEFMNIVGIDVDVNMEDENDALLKTFENNINSIGVSETNHIFIYIGSLIRRYSWTNDEPFNKMVDRNDKRATHRLYLDIEQRYTFVVPIRSANEFEEKYNVIFTDDISKVRNDFINTAVIENQEKAKEYVLTKYRK